MLNAKILEAEVLTNQYRADVTKSEGRQEEMSKRLRKLERTQGNAKDNLLEFKYYKEKEYRNLENLYHKLRFEFKQVEKSNEEFLVEIAQANRDNTIKHESRMQQEKAHQANCLAELYEAKRVDETERKLMGQRQRIAAKTEQFVATERHYPI